jgi:hypothetical protein
MTSDSDVGRRLLKFWATHNLQDAAHQTVISHLLIEPPRLAAEAARRSRGWAKLTSTTVKPVSDYQAAISDMIARDLVWEIDASKQSLIAEYLDADPALGPTTGMPDVGTLQIAIRLAKLLDDFWANVDGERPGAIWSREVQTDKLHLVYSPTRKQCLEFLRDELSDDDHGSVNIERVSGRVPCGPWRCQWWHKYESGYVLEVHYFPLGQSAR